MWVFLLFLCLFWQSSLGDKWCDCQVVPRLRKNPAVYRGLDYCWSYVLVQAQTCGIDLVAGQVKNTEENQADSLTWSWSSMCSAWLGERLVKMILFSIEKEVFGFVTPLISEFFENFSKIIIFYQCD